MSKFIGRSGRRERVHPAKQQSGSKCKHLYRHRRAVAQHDWHASFPRLLIIGFRDGASVASQQIGDALSDTQPKTRSNSEALASLKQPEGQLLKRLATRVLEIFLSLMRGTNS
jgi:hypothetical protein